MLFKYNEHIPHFITTWFYHIFCGFRCELIQEFWDALVDARQDGVDEQVEVLIYIVSIQVRPDGEQFMLLFNTFNTLNNAGNES